MIFLLWASPALVVIFALVSGRANPTVASVLGLIAAIPVALLYGPAAFSVDQLAHALLRGLWIGAVITPYILGGLLFWQVAAHGSLNSRPTAPQQATKTNANEQKHQTLANRRLLFFACFLVGPFAESATGFGVGMLGTVVLIRKLGFQSRHMMIFALLSQTFIPWGAMSSGTLLAAAYARIPAAQMALYAAVPVTLLMLVWLPLFWRTARLAGVGAPAAECVREALWVGTSIALLILSTAFIGPEAALLAAFGPLIVIRYFVDSRPDRNQVLVAARKVLPYLVLISGLVITRLVPGINAALSELLRVAPFDNLPAWSPLFHAGSWLILGAILTALICKRIQSIGEEAKKAWATGRHAVLTLIFFAMMAEVLAASGISGGFASSTYNALGEQAILITPFLAGAFGVLTNSGNPGNSLFLPSLVDLAAQAGLSIPAIAALQHVSGTAFGFFSPVRMAIAASLAMGLGNERKVYRDLWPFALGAFMLLTTLAAGMIWIP